MDLIGVGDNVVDKYINQNYMYPGGNALNVAVLAKQYGLKTAYLGPLGNDRAGNHIFNTLEDEGINTLKTKLKTGSNRYAEVILENGDRKFVGNDLGVYINFNLNQDDIEYIKNFKLAHTSIYSSIEPYLKQLNNIETKISFDYSTKFNSKYIEQTAPYIDIAFFSDDGLENSTEEDIKNFMTDVYEYGPDYVVTTMGKKGAIALHKNKFYYQPIFKIKNLVDTMGAGDAFIAMFLKGYICNLNIERILENAAKAAAKNCTRSGAIGHGITIKKE